MGALLIYNLFIMYFTRDITYLWYCGYLFGIMLHQVYYMGILELDILREPIKHRIIINAFIILSLFFMPLFTRAFLHTKQYLHKFDVVLKYMPFYFIAVFLVQKPQLMIILLVPVAFVFISIAITAYIKKIPGSNYYALGWLSISTGLMLMGLYNLGYAQFMSKIPYAIQMSIIFEALIFSIGLANRINQLKLEKAMADMKLIQLQKEEKEKLEKTVEIRTHELSNALKDKEMLFRELHHRVKNNLQMVISLIRIQKSKTENGTFKDIFISMQNRISSIGKLHDLLYKKSDLASISTKKYFDQIISEIQDSYDDAKDIDISLNVSADIPLEQITYCGLIINELVTNSIKYAFKGITEKKIYISLCKTDGHFILVIKDNGKGFDIDEDSDTMGLSVVKTLVKRQLKGSFFIDATNGMECKITFK
jgi:two-component sensor histidine kinase